MAIPIIRVSETTENSALLSNAAAPMPVERMKDFSFACAHLKGNCIPFIVR